MVTMAQCNISWSANSRWAISGPLGPLVDLVNSLASSFFVESSWNLQISMTWIKSWTSLKMDQIRPTIEELCALHYQNGHYWPCEQCSFFFFYWIFMKLADNNNMHIISDELENGSEWTNSGSVMSPWLSRLLVNTLQATFSALSMSNFLR